MLRTFRKTVFQQSSFSTLQPDAFAKMGRLQVWKTFVKILFCKQVSKTGASCSQEDCNFRNTDTAVGNPFETCRNFPLGTQFSCRKGFAEESFEASLPICRTRSGQESTEQLTERNVCRSPQFGSKLARFFSVLMQPVVTSNMKSTTAAQMRVAQNY